MLAWNTRKTDLWQVQCHAKQNLGVPDGLTGNQRMHRIDDTCTRILGTQNQQLRACTSDYNRTQN